MAKSDDLTEWETEFAEGVSERLDTFGSAFADPEKGGRGEALSYAQKKVVSSLKRKAKDSRKSGADDDYLDDDEDANSTFKPRSSFKSKRPKFKPRVRQLDEDFEDEGEPDTGRLPPKLAQSEDPPAPPPKGKPFLRIVKSDD